VDPKYYRKRFMVRMKRHIEAKTMVAGMGSTRATVDCISTNLQLNQDQRSKLQERVDAADGGDITPALVMPANELRRRKTGSGKKLSPRTLAPEPEPEPEPEHVSDEVENGSESSSDDDESKPARPRRRAGGGGPNSQRTPTPVGVSRAASPEQQLGGSE
jgi:hypothetical protein